jgi:hypothetical protein
MMIVVEQPAEPFTTTDLANGTAPRVIIGELSFAPCPKELEAAIEALCSAQTPSEESER